MSLLALAGFALLQGADLVEATRADPVTPGEWVYRRQDVYSSAATFAGLASLSCARAERRLRLVVAGAGANVPMTVSTTNGQWSIPANSDFSAFDPMADALAFSRGRFALAVEGGATLVLPARPAVARVIEDCRV